MKLFWPVASLGLAGVSAAWPSSPSHVLVSRSAENHRLVKRQSTYNFADFLKPMFKDYIRKPARIADVEPSGRRLGAKRTKLYFGPYTLPKRGEKAPPTGVGQFDPNSQTWANIVDFPTDITMLFTDHYLEYEDGRAANASNGVYSHHTLYMDFSKRWKSTWGCPGFTGSFYPQMSMNSLMNNQDEDNGISTFTSPDGTFDSGFYVARNDIVLNTGEVINYNEEEKKVYVVADIEYLPGRQPGFLDTSIQAFFVSGCDWTNIGGAMDLKLPSGAKKHVFRSKEMMIMEDGYIINMLGHLHDGGTNIVLRLNKQTVCDSIAEYGKSGGTSHDHGMMDAGGATNKAEPNSTKGVGAGEEYEGIVGMSRCDKAIKVTKGDRFFMEAGFDFEMHPARVQIQGKDAEVMGMFIVVFASKL